MNQRGRQRFLWRVGPREAERRERRELAREQDRQAERIGYARAHGRPDGRQRDLWPVTPPDVRAAEAAARRLIGRWLSYGTMHGRSLPDLEADLDAVAARLVGRVKHLDAAAAHRAGRSVWRRHRRRVASGAWARAFAALQAMRAGRRTVPRLRECERRDRRIVRLRKAGHSWRAIGARVDRSHENCRDAHVRLRKLSAHRLRMRQAARAARREAERRRSAAAGVNRAIRYRPCRYVDPGLIDPSGSARLPRARVRPGDASTFAALRRAAYVTWARFGPAWGDDERVEAVKRMAAQGGVPYDGSTVGAAVDAARFLWERRGRPGPHVALGRPRPDEPARRLDRTTAARTARPSRPAGPAGRGDPCGER